MGVRNGIGGGALLSPSNTNARRFSNTSIQDTIEINSKIDKLKNLFRHIQKKFDSRHNIRPLEIQKIN